ncbi:hypothetical protein CR513_41822, partial [Mucuna pruriens]
MSFHFIFHSTPILKRRLKSSLSRSNRERQSSIRYTSDEYVTLTDGEEPECYQEAMENEERQKSVSTPLAIYFKLSSRHNPSNEAEKINMRRVPYKALECCEMDLESIIHLDKNSTFHSSSKHIDVRYHWIRDALNAKLLELTKVYTDDNGTDMMNKTVPRRKFEALD